VLSGGGGGDVFSSNGGGGGDEFNSNGGSGDEFYSNSGGGGGDEFNSNSGGGVPSAYPTPPPRFPCGPNAIENQAWGGPFASGFLGMLAPLVTPPCIEAYAPRPKSYGCVKARFDVRADVPDADPKLRYTLGFETGFNRCVENQITVQNLVLAVLAMRFRQVAALLMIAAAPQAIDAVLHPPGTSPNPNPYLRGKEEGYRLCDWTIKVAPYAIRKCGVPLRPLNPGREPGVQKCSTEDPGYGNNPGGAIPTRMDCVQCTMNYLLGRPQLPPGTITSPMPAEVFQAKLKAAYGNLIPQGPALLCWRMSAQRAGLPASTWPRAIEAEMSNAGPGAKAVVFYNTLDSDVGHVFAAENNGGQVRFWDAQQGMDGSLWFTNPNIVWWGIYRIQ